VVEEPYFIALEKFIKGCFKMIRKKELVAKFTPIIRHIRGSLKKGKKMGEVGSNGQMVKCMMDNGKTV
jgi:hypothetical protein